MNKGSTGSLIKGASRLAMAYLFGASTLLASGAAQAALLDRGGGMIYDTDLNITWLSDANYAVTSGYAAANARDNGTSAKDNIVADGRMGWEAAVAWADQLVFGGFEDWRLPTALNADGSGPCSGVNCTGSEMGHLFYNELGGNAGESILNTTGDAAQEIANLALFTNVQWVYWSGTAYAPFPADLAWDFFTQDGFQDFGPQFGGLYAWAVRPGDVAAVPEPSSLMLAVLALAGIGAARRRGRFGAS